MSEATRTIFLPCRPRRCVSVILTFFVVASLMHQTCAFIQAGFPLKNSARGAPLPAALSLFSPTLESQPSFAAAERSLVMIHGGKCSDYALMARDARFWSELTAATSQLYASNGNENDKEQVHLWRFEHFLRTQRMMSLAITGRNRTEGVSRISLGPLKDLDEGRRQVRALCHFPGLVAVPWHEPQQFEWLKRLHASRHVISEELHAYQATTGLNEWGGNDCEEFDQHGWTEILLQSYGHNQAAAASFPRTMALLSDAALGPREVSVVRQAGNSGLPRHSDQRNYMLTAHVVLSSSSQEEGNICKLTVDGEARPWTSNGEPTVIDTTFWHSTWNESPEHVDILLVDFWHPGLSLAEKRAMQIFVDLEGAFLREPLFGGKYTELPRNNMQP